MYEAVGKRTGFVGMPLVTLSIGGISVPVAAGGGPVFTVVVEDAGSVAAGGAFPVVVGVPGFAV